MNIKSEEKLTFFLTLNDKLLGKNLKTYKSLVRRMTSS